MLIVSEHQLTALDHGLVHAQINDAHMYFTLHGGRVRDCDGAGRLQATQNRTPDTARRQIKALLN